MITMFEWDYSWTCLWTYFKDMFLLCVCVFVFSFLFCIWMQPCFLGVVSCPKFHVLSQLIVFLVLVYPLSISTCIFYYFHVYFTGIQVLLVLFWMVYRHNSINLLVHTTKIGVNDLNSQFDMQAYDLNDRKGVL
jgi:hypothetical protein